MDCSSEERDTETTTLLGGQKDPERYSVFTDAQKRSMIITASIASTFSPLSANIYYPALNSLAADLHVSHSLINLTIMSYMLFQALAPTVAGSLADILGRRPVYIICFLIYIAADVGLGLQRNFAALLILRAVQSSGSSATVALASAIAADIVTSAERGMYMGIASLGAILAPSLGPILGGLLSQYLGWPSIFWFLAIAAAAFFVPFILFFPETCRAVVGNGSMRAPIINRTLFQCLNRREKDGDEGTGSRSQTISTKKRRIRLPNPLATVRILFRLPIGFIMLGNGIAFASYYAVMSSVPSQFEIIYGLNNLQIGLAFIPAGFGTLCSAIMNGMLVDWNYRRIEAQLGRPNGRGRGRRQDVKDFPIERARLQIALPMMSLAAASIASYGWSIHYENPIWVPLTVLFIIAFSVTGAYNVMNLLVVDLNYSTPATAMAANNLMRCTLGAAATAGVHPLLNLLGKGLSYTCIAGVIVAASPLLLATYKWGLSWRTTKASYTI